MSRTAPGQVALAAPDQLSEVQFDRKRCGGSTLFSALVP